MFAAKNGATVRALFEGDTSAYAEDDSRADEALCFHLAFWTGGDREQIDRLFRQSGLYREKWERRDYRERTIDNALAFVHDHYAPGQRKQLKSNGHKPAAGQPPGPMPDVDGFWSARQELQILFDFALARRASPWAVLGVTLARVVAATPPAWRLPPLIGAPASLNLFVSLVGVVGAGKGAAERAGEDAVSFGSTIPFQEHTPGSGQGIAHAFGHYDQKSGKVVRHAVAAYLSLDEVDHFVGLFGQQGSTLRAELRRLFMGERLGHLFVDPTKRIEIEAHTYRASLVVAVQPKRGGVLMDDADGGTPQRFLWLPVVYPHPDERPAAEPELLRWRLPILDKAGPYLMPVCPAAAEAIDAAHLARARGEGNALDGHLLLVREKVAAALALLSGGVEVKDEDWQLAGVIMEVSAQTREQVAEALAELAQQGEHARASRAVHVQQRLDEDANARALAAAQRQAVAHVVKGVCPGGCKRRCVTQAIASKYRIAVSIDEVIANALARDLLVQTDDVYMPGKRAPA